MSGSRKLRPFGSFRPSPFAHAELGRDLEEGWTEPANTATGPVPFAASVQRVEGGHSLTRSIYLYKFQRQSRRRAFSDR